MASSITILSLVAESVKPGENWHEEKLRGLVTLNPKPFTLYPKPLTRNPKP